MEENTLTVRLRDGILMYSGGVNGRGQGKRRGKTKVGLQTAWLLLFLTPYDSRRPSAGPSSGRSRLAAKAVRSAATASSSSPRFLASSRAPSTPSAKLLPLEIQLARASLARSSWLSASCVVGAGAVSSAPALFHPHRRFCFPGLRLLGASAGALSATGAGGWLWAAMARNIY